MNLLNIMKNKWWTIPELRKEIKRKTGKWYMETTVSRMIRDLRKEEFGGHTVPREHIRNGLWRYRVYE